MSTTADSNDTPTADKGDAKTPTTSKICDHNKDKLTDSFSTQTPSATKDLQQGQTNFGDINGLSMITSLLELLKEFKYISNNFS
jgi:hypothetical protein